MVKICLVNGVYPPDEFGGAENYVQRTATALKDRGHDVFILTTSTRDRFQNSFDIKKEIIEGIPIYRFFPLNHSHRSEGTGNNIVTKGLWHALDTVNPHAKKVVSRFLQRKRPDIVHTNNFMGISSTIGKAIEESNARFIHMLHDYSLICPKSNLLRERTLPKDKVGVCQNPPAPCELYATAKNITMGKPDAIISPSQHVIDIHNEHGFFNDIPTTRVKHGVRKVAQTLPPGSSDKAIIYVGKHLKAKGLETLFTAAKQMPNVTVHLCGTGPFDSKSKMAAEKFDNIQYHGFVSDERLRDLRKSVAAAIVPSLWMENSPLVIYESFAVGLPVIGADIGGIPELVDDDRGDLFPSGDANALANCVSDFVNNHRTDNSMKENSLDWARQHTINDHINGLLECYKPY